MIVLTWRVFEPLAMTKTSVMARMSPTRTTATSNPFLSTIASAATSARPTAESCAGPGVKRWSTGTSSAVIVELPGPDPLNHCGRDHAVDRTPAGEPVAQVGRRDVEAGDRDPLVAPPLPRRRRLRVARPLDDDDG